MVDQVRVTGNGQLQAYTFDGSEVYVTGTTVVEPNKWYHVVVTARNSGSMHLYVNVLTMPVNARFVQFRTLSSSYLSGNVGLNELQLIADLTPGKLNIEPALLLSWPYGPIKMVLQSSTDGQNWTQVADAPSLAGITYKLFRRAEQGVTYRLVPQ